MTGKFTISRGPNDTIDTISDVDWSLHYQRLGEFIAEYEKITFYSKFTYSCLLQANGLKEFALITNVMNIDTIGPRHLCICWCAAARKLFPTDKELHAKVDKINKEVDDLAKIRNEIAHGEWSLGPEVAIVTNDKQLPLTMGIKRKLSKEGEKIEDLPSLDEFAALIGRTRQAVEDVKDIYNGVVMRVFRDARQVNSSSETR